MNATSVQTLYESHKAFFLSIFNASSAIGYFPKQWRKFRIILIPKADSKKKAGIEKYRPIAVNPIIGKVFEKLIKDRIYHYLHITKHLPKHQYGFKHNTSTTMAQSNIKKNIVHAKLDKKGIAIISLDTKNAFISKK